MYPTSLVSKIAANPIRSDFLLRYLVNGGLVAPYIAVSNEDRDRDLTGALWDADIISVEADGITFKGGNGPSGGSASLVLKFDYTGNLIEIVSVYLTGLYNKDITEADLRKEYIDTRLFGFDEIADLNLEAIADRLL